MYITIQLSKLGLKDYTDDLTIDLEKLEPNEITAAIKAHLKERLEIIQAINEGDFIQRIKLWIETGIGSYGINKTKAFINRLNNSSSALTSIQCVIDEINHEPSSKLSTSLTHWLALYFIKSPAVTSIIAQYKLNDLHFRRWVKTAGCNNSHNKTIQQFKEDTLIAYCKNNLDFLEWCETQPYQDLFNLFSNGFNTTMTEYRFEIEPSQKF